MKEIMSKLNDLDFFNLKDKYDIMITDIPSTIITVYKNNKQKRVIARAKIPQKLIDFNNLIHSKFVNEGLI